MTEIPGNPWQLTGTIGESSSEARDGTGHAVAQRFRALPSQSIWAGKGNEPPWSIPARSSDGRFRRQFNRHGVAGQPTIQRAHQARFVARTGHWFGIDVRFL